MNFTVEDISSVKKKVIFEIPAEQAAQALDEAYNDLKKTAKIKGFRPGKVPRSVLEHRYAREMKKDVGGSLIQSSWLDFAKESQLAILGMPEIDPGDFDDTGAFKYSATIEVAPQIADIDFKGMHLTQNVYRIPNEMIARQLEAQQRFQADKKPLEEKRPLQSGDLALVDYEGFKDGEAFAGTPRSAGATLRVGAGQILPDFDHQLLGMQAGETREITITFPDEYGKLELAGQQITFQVTLHDILEEILPPIDDAFAKKLGNYESLEALKKSIADDLQARYTQRSQQELHEEVFETLLARTDFEVPEVLIKIEQDNIVRDFVRFFEMQNVSMEERGLNPDQFGGKYRDVAEKQARRHLILDKLAHQENLTVPDDMLEQEYVKISHSNQSSLEDIKTFFSNNPEKLAGLKQTLLENEALQRVINAGKIDKVESDAVIDGPGA